MKRFQLLLLVPLISRLAWAQPGTTGVCWSGDGRYLAVGLPTKKIAIFELASGRRTLNLQAPGQPMAQRSFDPDSSYRISDSIAFLNWRGPSLVGGGEDGEVRLWSPPESRVLAKVGIGYNLCSVALSQDGKVMAYSDCSTRALDSTVQAYRIHKNQLSPIPLPDTGDPESNYNAVQLSPSGRYLALSNANRVWLRDLVDARSSVLDIPSTSALGANPRLALSDEVLAIYYEGKVQWRAVGQPEKIQAELKVGEIDYLAFVGQGLCLHRDNELLEVQGQRIIQRLRFSQRPEALSPDGAQVATRPTPGRVKIYERRSGRLLQVLKL